MDLIGKDKLLKIYSIRPQAAHETYCLRKFDVAIVIAMNQQYRGLPFIYRPNRRRVARVSNAFRSVGGHPQAGHTYTPVMHPMKINARREDIGIPRQTKRGQVPTIRSTPKSDALFVDVVPVA